MSRAYLWGPEQCSECRLMQMAASTEGCRCLPGSHKHGVNFKNRDKRAPRQLQLADMCCSIACHPGAHTHSG